MTLEVRHVDVGLLPPFDAIEPPATATANVGRFTIGVQHDIDAARRSGLPDRPRGEPDAAGFWWTYVEPDDRGSPGGWNAYKYYADDIVTLIWFADERDVEDSRLATLDEAITAATAASR